MIHPLIEFKNVTKHFGHVKANENVSFSVSKSSIHALVGENGAGKSTIMKILFGLYQKDSGQIFLNGKEVHFYSPTEAKRAGFGMVHQHFMLAGSMLAVDHFFLEETDRSFLSNLLSPLNKRRMLDDLQVLSEKFSMPVPWAAHIENLTVGIQQRIEILKILYNKSEIFILDEPTAVLNPTEIKSFFKQLQQLKNEGKTIILITHKLKEVMSIADRVTVFRKGHAIQTLDINDCSEENLAELMIGSKLGKASRDLSVKLSDAKVVVKNLKVFEQGRPKVDDISFQIRGGEILGVAGVEGNGQSELIKALLAPLDYKHDLLGEIEILGQKTQTQTTFHIRSLGVGYLPESRLEQGVLLQQSATNNFLLGHQRSRDFQHRGWLKLRRIKEATSLAFQKMDVRPKNLELSIKNFSGGNQQKIVVARELLNTPGFLIAAQPTRGVDIGSIQTIYKEILALRQKGSAILLISSELSEILELSDRVLVFFEGKIVADLENRNLSEDQLGLYMSGAK